MTMSFRNESHLKHSPKDESEIREVLEELINSYDKHLQSLHGEKHVMFSKKDRELVATIMLRKAEKDGRLLTVTEVSRVNVKGVLEENKRIMRELNEAYVKRLQQKELFNLLVKQKLVATDASGLVVEIGDRKTITQHKLDEDRSAGK